MADPKYANLPGIAHDQPDCFETSELPEADQHLEDQQDQSDSVETLHLSATEAFGRFKGKHLDAGKVDFSDRLRPATQRKGYVSWSGDFELTARGEDESPLQKYQRLNCEVRELFDELAEAKKSGVGGADGDGGAATTLSSVALQVTGLQDELASLRLEETLGSEALQNMRDPRQAANAKLLAHLEQFKRGKAGKATSASAVATKGDGGDQVTYELMMKPEAAKMEEREIVARFDKRLEALEKALGANVESMSALSVETSQKSVLGAISVLSARTALLEPAHLDHIEGRLASLQAKMNAVAERKQVVEEQDKEHKINDLYDLVQRIQAMGNVLPAVVDRLDALQELHEQALQFSKTMTQLDSVQQKLTSSLGNNESLLKETQTKFATNIANIQKNFQNVEERLNKLGK